MAKRKTFKFGLALLALACLLLGLFFWALNRPAPNLAEAVVMTPCGYTNPPGNHLRFARITISNQSSHTIRWRGDWVEYEGDPTHHARTINPNLPESERRTYTLKPGGAFVLACGEPLEARIGDGIRWRLGVGYSPYTWGERLYDFGRKHNLPLSLDSFSFVSVQRCYNLTNQTIATSPWLGKENPNAKPPQ